jgi:hypothetical protein
MAQLRTSLLATSALLMNASVGFAAGDRVPPPPQMLMNGIAVTSRHGVPVLMVAPPGRANAAARGSVPAAYDATTYDGTTTFDNINRKFANAEFLSWYGFSASAGYSYSSCDDRPGSGYCYSATWFVANAIPIIGKGRTVTTIEVPIYSYERSATFNVGLYSSVGGLPGEEVAGASTTGASTTYCCSALRTVKIPRTTLAKGTQYFVVVAPVTNNSGSNYANEGLWLLEDTDYAVNQSDYVFIDKTTRSCTTSLDKCRTTHIGSGWQPSTEYPAEPAAIVK